MPTATPQSVDQGLIDAELLPVPEGPGRQVYFVRVRGTEGGAFASEVVGLTSKPYYVVFCLDLLDQPHAEPFEAVKGWVQILRAREDRDANPLGPAIYVIGPPAGPVRWKPWQIVEINRAGAVYLDRQNLERSALARGFVSEGSEQSPSVSHLKFYFRDDRNKAGRTKPAMRRMAGLGPNVATDRASNSGTPTSQPEIERRTVERGGRQTSQG